MKNLAAVLFLMSLLSLTSCMSFYETIRFQPDGSGTYEMAVDMGDMMSGIEGLGGMMNGMGLGEQSEEMGGVDTMMQMLDTMVMDTVISFRDLPEEAKAQFHAPDLVDKISMQMQMNKEEGLLNFAFRSDFDEFAQLKEIFTVMERMKEENELGEGAAFSEFIPIGSENFWTLKRNKLSREGIGLSSDWMDDLSMDSAELGQEDMAGMMNMFMGNMKYRTEIHFPAKVKKVTLEGARVDGNKVILEHSLLDIMNDQEKDYSGFIKFKKTW